jgi:hypothetical protein
MSKPKVYADFHNLDDMNRLRLSRAGTIADLAGQGIELQEGLALTFCMDDADDQGKADELRADGIVHYDEYDRVRVASVDWSAVRHSSDERTSVSAVAGASVPTATGENGPTQHGCGQHSPTAKLSR